MKRQLIEGINGERYSLQFFERVDFSEIQIGLEKIFERNLLKFLGELMKG